MKSSSVAGGTQCSTVAGRTLTDEVRDLLVNNTARLLERFEAQRVEEEIARLSAEQARLAEQTRLASRPAYQAIRTKRSPQHGVVAAVRVEALANLALRFPGVDLKLAGFAGLLSMEVERILADRR